MYGGVSYILFYVIMLVSLGIISDGVARDCCNDLLRRVVVILHPAMAIWQVADSQRAAMQFRRVLPIHCRSVF
jgi:hypothetical protein